MFQLIIMIANRSSLFYRGSSAWIMAKRIQRCIAGWMPLSFVRDNYCFRGTQRSADHARAKPRARSSTGGLIKIPISTGADSPWASTLLMRPRRRTAPPRHGIKSSVKHPRRTMLSLTHPSVHRWNRHNYPVLQIVTTFTPYTTSPFPPPSDLPPPPPPAEVSHRVSVGIN